MKGCHNGLPKILCINHRAFFTPCAVYTLNLVVNEVADIPFETMDLFAIIQEPIILSGSFKCWWILKDSVPILVLYLLAVILLICRIDSLKPLTYQLPQIHDPLYEMYLESGNNWFVSRTKLSSIFVK